MKRVEVPSYPVSIFTAGDYAQAVMVCREYCDEVGLCVTVSPTVYVYTEGQESGCIVGLINYPRFPVEPQVIHERAEQLAALLRERLGQQSYTIQSPASSAWWSHRDEDAALRSAALDLREALTAIIKSGVSLTQEQRIHANAALRKASAGVDV